MNTEIVKLNKRELLKEKARISYLQILILIVSTFAIAYLIAMTDEEIIKEVSAASVLNCCPSDCNDYLSSQCAGKCSSQCQPTKCSDFSDCKIGCCYDKSQGTCSANSPKKKCEQDGGLWKDSAECSSNKIQECKLGCCVLGGESELVTADRCLKLASERGLSADFRAGVTNEGACIFLSISQKRGACLLPDKGCRMLTNQECKSLTGKLTIQDSLCTSSSLETNCEPTDDTICIEGKDEVYFADSCGNAANIYDSSKTYSKNPGYWDIVVSKDNSCGINNLNGNSNSQSCGNCNYFLGSKCKNYQQALASKPVNGENICADLSCKQAAANVGKKDRRNGESWCVYDGAIGNGDDVPGSRHWKYSCIDGEVKVEPCADYRNEICVQNDTSLGNNQVFSSASCRINNWQACIEASTAGKPCDGVDCFKKRVAVSKGFSFDVCVPQYPKGFDNKDASAEQICGIASSSCTVIYEKKLSGWKCMLNCECEKATFTKQMNDLCRSLGDCGGEVNIEGKYVANYQVSGAPKLGDTSILKKLMFPVPGQFAPPGFDKLMESGIAGKSLKFIAGIGAGAGAIAGIVGAIQISSALPNVGFWGGLQLSTMGTTSIGKGATATTYSVQEGGLITSQIADQPAQAVMTTGQAPFMNPTPVQTPTSASFANGLVAGLIVTAVTMIAVKVLKLKGDAAQVVSLAGAVGSVVAGISAAKVGLGACLAAGVCLFVILAIIVLALIMKFLGIGKSKKVTVSFTCKPWQPPSGGADCAKCAKDSLKPCSEYRCESLGQACQFVNEGTKDESCISAQDDGQAPVISPWQEILDSNFTYTEISERGFQIREAGGGCVQAFSPLTFGIKTNEASQCKFDVQSKVNFESMENDFGSNAILMNHSMGFSMPSIEAIISEFSEENLTYQYVLNKLGTVRLYTRCQDVFGHYNPTEYVIDVCIKAGPDLTAPYILRIEPENNAFIANGITRKDVNLYLNEPADCKWSKDEKKNYSAMENLMTCKTGLQEAGIYGWQCNTTLTGLTGTNNTFYFRCRDQPWLEGTINASQRNANIQSYNYKLIVSESPLTITKIEPNGSVSAGSEPIVLDLTAETSGGIENGKAECEYSFTGKEGSYAPFWDSFASSHKQHLNQLTAGDYNVYVKCTDDAGNIAKASIGWDLSVDYSTPIITRVYNDNNELFISTSEDSECAYSSDCNFVFENATQLGGGFTREHSTGWTAGKTYYIKCRDAWNNEPDGCSIKVKAYSTGESSILA